MAQPTATLNDLQPQEPDTSCGWQTAPFQYPTNDRSTMTPTDLYDQDTASPYVSEVEFGTDGLERLDGRPMRHGHRSPVRQVMTGILIGVLLAGVLTAAVLLIADRRRPGPAVVKLHTTSVTTAPKLGPIAPAPPVYNPQGLVVPPGTPGAVTADAGPPAIITVGGTTAPNPLMATVPGVVYTAPRYFGAPVEGTIVASAAPPSVVDTEGNSAAAFARIMHLPPDAKLALVGGYIVGYVPEG